MAIIISNELFDRIKIGARRKELFFLLDMPLANSWWSTQVGVKHLAKYCPFYLRILGLILNNLPIGFILLAIYLFFIQEFGLGIFSILLIFPIILFVPKLSCIVVRFMAKRNKMFFIDLYVSGVLHILIPRRKETVSYPQSIEEIFS